MVHFFLLVLNLLLSLPKADIPFCFFIATARCSFDKPNTWKWKLFICLEHDMARIPYQIYNSNERPKREMKQKNKKTEKHFSAAVTTHKYREKWITPCVWVCKCDRDENNIHLFDLIHYIQNAWNACWLPRVYMCVCVIGCWETENISYFCWICVRYPTVQWFAREKCSKLYLFFFSR